MLVNPGNYISPSLPLLISSYLRTAKTGVNNHTPEHSGEILYFLMVCKIPTATNVVSDSISPSKNKN